MKKYDWLEKKVFAGSDTVSELISIEKKGYEIFSISYFEGLIVIFARKPKDDK